MVAAGAGSGALDGLPDGARVPVRPVKGQILRLRGDPRRAASRGASIRTPEVYAVPRADGRLVVARRSRSAASTRRSPPAACSSCCGAPTRCCPGSPSWSWSRPPPGCGPATPDNAPDRRRGRGRRARVGDRALAQRRPARARDRRRGRALLAGERRCPSRSRRSRRARFAPAATRCGGGAMRVIVNGDRASCPTALTVAELVARRGAGRRRTAAASRSRSTPRWCRAASGSDTTLAEGQRVEVLAAIQGGAEMSRRLRDRRAGAGARA